MGKRDKIKELTNILAIALRHKIGATVNSNEIYAGKYARDADVLIREAEKVNFGENWNSSDKDMIKRELKKKLILELEKRDFIDNKKFNFVDSEIELVLDRLLI